MMSDEVRRLWYDLRRAKQIWREKERVRMRQNLAIRVLPIHLFSTCIYLFHDFTPESSRYARP